MKVEIECNVKVVGDTIDEALARMAEKLMVIQLHDTDREKLAKEYRFWNNENEGDVDWTPINLTNKNKDGSFASAMSLSIRNI